MHLSTLQKEKWALVGLLHPYISTPSTVTHLQPSHSYSWTVTHPFNCHSLNHHTLIIHPHHHTLHPSPYTLYLMVESSDPVTMTLSSYCRHSTGPVWPCSSVVTLRDLRSQICSEWRVSCHNSHTNDYNLQVNFIMPWLLPRQHIASFPGTWRGAPDSHSLHIHGPPGLSGEFGTKYPSMCPTIVHYWSMGVITSTGHMLCAFSTVGKPRIVRRDEQLVTIQHI